MVTQVAPLSFQQKSLNKLQSISDVATTANTVVQQATQKKPSSLSVVDAALAKSQQGAVNLQSTQNAQYAAKLAAKKQAQAATVAAKATGTPVAAAAIQYKPAKGLSDARNKIIQTASAQIGTPYSWGGGGTKGKSKGIAQGANTVGFDCSGLVQFVYGQVGMALPRTAKTQGVVGKKTSISSLQPGDLVAWNSGKHIAIYAGNGQILEAPRTGLNVRQRALSKKEMGSVHGVALNL